MQENNKVGVVDKLLQLLEESVLISGTLALLIAGAIGYLVVRQYPIPSELYNLAVVVFAFFFDSKNRSLQEKTTAHIADVSSVQNRSVNNGG